MRWCGQAAAEMLYQLLPAHCALSRRYSCRKVIFLGKCILLQAVRQHQCTPRGPSHMVLLALPPAAPTQRQFLCFSHITACGNPKAWAEETPSQMLPLQHFLQIFPSFLRTFLVLSSKLVPSSFRSLSSAEAQTVTWCQWHFLILIP